MQPKLFISFLIIFSALSAQQSTREMIVEGFQTGWDPQKEAVAYRGPEILNKDSRLPAKVYTKAELNLRAEEVYRQAVAIARTGNIESYQKKAEDVIRYYHTTSSAAQAAYDLSRFETMIGNTEKAQLYAVYLANMHFNWSNSTEAIYLLSGLLYANRHRDEAVFAAEFLIENRDNNIWWYSAVKLLADIYRGELSFYTSASNKKGAKKIIKKMAQLEQLTLPVDINLELSSTNHGVDFLDVQLITKLLYTNITTNCRLKTSGIRVHLPVLGSSEIWTDTADKKNLALLSEERKIPGLTENICLIDYQNFNFQAENVQSIYVWTRISSKTVIEKQFELTSAVQPSISTSWITFLKEDHLPVLVQIPESSKNEAMLLKPVFSSFTQGSSIILPLPPLDDVSCLNTSLKYISLLMIKNPSLSIDIKVTSAADDAEIAAVKLSEKLKKTLISYGADEQKLKTSGFSGKIGEISIKITAP